MQNDYMLPTSYKQINYPPPSPPPPLPNLLHTQKKIIIAPLPGPSL